MPTQGKKKNNSNSPFGNTFHYENKFIKIIGYKLYIASSNFDQNSIQSSNFTFVQFSPNFHVYSFQASR